MLQVDVSGSNFDPSGYDRGGLPGPGKCHLRVDDVEVRNGRNGAYLSITCQILAHEDETNVGKTTYNTFTLAGKGVNRLLTYCQACGVLTKEDVMRWWQQSGDKFGIPADETEGCTFCGTLEEGKNPNNGKKTCKVEFDFVNASSPEAADYPKDASAIKATGNTPAPVDEDTPF